MVLQIVVDCEFLHDKQAYLKFLRGHLFIFCYLNPIFICGTFSRKYGYGIVVSTLYLLCMVFGNVLVL